METKVTINNKEVVIKKMALGRYGKLLEALDNLPPEVSKAFTSLDTSKPESLITQLPVLMGKSWDNMVGVLSVATGLDKKYLEEECDLVDGVNLLKAVFEVNDFLSVKNALATLLKSRKAEVAKETKTG